MKQKIILWIAACIITYLAGYLHSVTDKDFPINGTIGIEGKQVSYHFERLVHVKDTMNIIIRTDTDSLQGKVFLFQSAGDTTITNFYTADNGKALIAPVIVKQVPGTIHYAVRLFRNGKQYDVPANSQYIETQCVGRVPASIWSIYYLTLFGGLLLAVRIGLEYFNENIKTKKLTVFATIAFNLYGFFVIPVKNTFELNVLDKVVAQPAALFSLHAFIPGFFWIVMSIIIMRSQRNTIWGVVAAVGTLLLLFVV